MLDVPGRPPGPAWSKIRAKTPRLGFGLFLNPACTAAETTLHADWQPTAYYNYHVLAKSLHPNVHFHTPIAIIDSITTRNSHTLFSFTQRPTNTCPELQNRWTYRGRLNRRLKHKRENVCALDLRRIIMQSLKSAGYSCASVTILRHPRSLVGLKIPAVKPEFHPGSALSSTLLQHELSQLAKAINLKSTCTPLIT